MAKIILVDADSNFLSNLEWYFFKQSDEHEIITISDRNYLYQFFSNPQTADALVIAEDMYFSELEKHNITHVFTLTESLVESGTERLDGRRMSKYTTSVPEMYNIITGILKTANTNSTTQTAATNVVMVYSPIGGVGTTSVAVGLCASLYKNYKKVLFLSAEGLQTFGTFFHGEYFLDCWQNNMFKAEREEAIVSLKEMVRNELCDYLPPFNSPLPSVPLDSDDYIHLINAIRSLKCYEYIVIDCGSEFTKDISALMGVADKVVIVYDHEERSEHKIECLLNSINYSDRTKFIFLHNRYMPGREPCKLDAKFYNSKYTVETIWQSGSDPFPTKVDGFLGYKGFQELTNAIL